MNVVISLGGSLIYPRQIDYGFINKFKALVEEYLEKGFSFIIITGGGKLARDMQKKAKNASDEEKDWLGIDATKKNAELLKSVFREEDVHGEIINDPSKKIETDKNIIIASGWKPGFSTDYDAVLLAQNNDAHIIINMSNIEYVYNKDPKHHKDAQPLKEISWVDFRKLVGEGWTPGLNMPFDPVAAKHAHEHSEKIYIIGKDLDNLRNLLDKKDFKGTVIE